jgi:hypothetical protein
MMRMGKVEGAIMKLKGVPTDATVWAGMRPYVQAGATGTATARSRQLGDIQVRLVEYSRDYLSDHWCPKGHLVYVVEGSLIIEHEDGRVFDLAAGSSYQVSDDDPAPHRVVSKNGATIFVVD